jgi:hypothetical protein
MGFLAYQLLYIQLPLIVFPFPKNDFSHLAWVDNSPYIGLYPYEDSVMAQFENQKYINRSILGEEDFFLISGQEKYDSIPYSYFRAMNGDYGLLQFHFDRKLDYGSFSGGFLGLREGAETGFKGYGNFSLPFILNGNISAGAYGDIYNFSLNCDYLFFETTSDKWFGYLKLGDARAGVTHDDREFVSYLFRPRDPIFLIMANFVGKGLFGDEDFEMEDFYIAPVYLLSLEESIYFIFSKNPAVGLKSRFGDLEIGKENCLLALNTDFFKAFANYSFEDSSLRGAFEGKLEYSFYDKKITPGLKGTFYDNEKFDLEMSLKILEVKFFWAITGITLEGYRDRQFWGMDIFFSF